MFSIKHLKTLDPAGSCHLGHFCYRHPDNLQIIPIENRDLLTLYLYAKLDSFIEDIEKKCCKDKVLTARTILALLGHYQVNSTEECELVNSLKEQLDSTSTEEKLNNILIGSMFDPILTCKKNGCHGS